MGAVAAILYSEGLKNAPPLVLDSPFACLTEVIDDMIKRYKLVPNLIKEFLLKRITEHIKDVACFDLNNINPISTAKKCRNSAIFVHSFEDRLVNIDHSRKLYIE